MPTPPKFYPVKLMGRWTDGWTHGQMGGRTDGWMDGRADRHREGPQGAHPPPQLRCRAGWTPSSQVTESCRWRDASGPQPLGGPSRGGCGAGHSAGSLALMSWSQGPLLPGPPFLAIEQKARGPTEGDGAVCGHGAGAGTGHGGGVSRPGI